MARPGGGRRVSSNKAFRNTVKKVQKGAGPVYNYFKEPPTQKNKFGTIADGPVGCGGEIDNNVTYVFDVGPDGSRLAYVDCDYVE